MMLTTDTSLYHEQVAKKTNWTGMAFLIEAMVLLLLLAASLAVIMSMFAAAYTQGQESQQRSGGIIVASDLAEEFCADPQGVLSQERFIKGDYLLTITADEIKKDNGILYDATIMVQHIGDEGGDVQKVYTLRTARYVSGVV